jgi:23S rRNA (cytidine1920-2'-O)/16S rRNA (cytidine1409-2'-O)-methyltransferase
MEHSKRISDKESAGRDQPAQSKKLLRYRQAGIRPVDPEINQVAFRFRSNAIRDKKKNIRLDQLLIIRGLVKDIHQAEALILTGKVKLFAKPPDSGKAKSAIRIPQSAIDLYPGTMVSPEIEIDIAEPKCPYVSRGGLKLAGALAAFKIDVQNKIAIDIGASTGGFTDCLLQNGIKKVYAIDVGYGHFASKLRPDPRVVLFEKVNARYLTLETLRNAECGLRNKNLKSKTRNPNELLNPKSSIRNPKFDVAVIDVSFISLTKIIPAVISLLKEGGEIVALIKPQFEIAKSVGKKNRGVVRDPELREAAVRSIAEFAIQSDLQVIGTVPAVITGPAGNQEYFIYLRKIQTDKKSDSHG